MSYRFMKKGLWFFNLAIILLTCSSSKADVNLLNNGNFEEGQAGWVIGKPWSFERSGGRSDSSCVMIDYREEHKQKGLSHNKVAVNAEKYCRASIWARTEGQGDRYTTGGTSFYGSMPDKKWEPIWTFTSYNLHSSWSQLVNYFNTGSLQEAAVYLYMENAPPGKIWVDDAELVELTDEQLKGNLLYNPDFEEGEDGDFPCGWNDSEAWRKDKRAPVKISLDSKAGYIKGEKSLKLDGMAMSADSKECDGVQSIYVPAVPGVDYVFSVWMKGQDSETTARLVVDGHKPDLKHWYKEKYYKLDSSWSKYKLEVRIPGPESADNFVPGRLVRLRIMIQGRGVLWADEASFEQR